ncbi:MAG: FAD-binding protein [Candidatus Doudnabacteria bacterium]|nr:FAD-binding protein [Candidatus Doudnabacteria bacterium]
MIRNFGHNVKFEPKHYYTPHSESEVLDILNSHKNGKIRAHGSFHAWNGGIKSEDVLLNLELINHIKLVEEQGESYAVVGGGCKLQDLVRYLEKKSLAVPTMGGIMKQTVAGLASTATHGTGRSSFSHYLSEIRIAAYENGKAKIFTYSSGDELRAARTAVGCLGVIVSIKIKVVPRFWIQEQLRKYETLDQALALEHEWPLTQFGLIPYSWKFVAFQRRIASEPSQWQKFRALFARMRDYLFIEASPHALLKLILTFPNRKKSVLWYYNFLPKLLLNVDITNIDYQALTLHVKHHYQFRHLEMEVFVPEEHIRAAAKTIRDITQAYSDSGKYIHHYIYFFRKVLPDDTLISMTAGDKSYYAIGVFTYDKEQNRKAFYEFAHTLAVELNQKYGARFHWGKYIPLDHHDLTRLYPEMDKFKELCRNMDPQGVFRNDFITEKLGF